MDGILDLFESVAESPRLGEYLDEFLKSCTEHQAFSVQKSSAVQPFIKFTNSKLSIHAERLEGLLLLRTFLPQCSDEQFTDNAVNWMLHIVKGIETKECIETNSLSYDVLRILLEMGSNFKEMIKNVNVTVVPKFVEQLQRTEAKPQVKLSALRCVQVLIRNYGAPCSTHRNAIEKFILQFADSKDEALVSVAARCFALLPLVGGGGTLGVNHKTRWLEQQQRTCSTLRFLLDQLFEHVQVVDSFVQEVSHDKLPLELLTDMNPVIRVHQIANRFINVAKFLEAMMLGAFPVTKSVLPDQIFGVVCRGLSVDCTTLGSRLSSDLLAVSSVLPKLHVSLLSVLQALIACLGKNLYPYARLICKLTLQSLKWTASSTKSYALTRPYAALRVEACRTLEAWLRVAKAGSCVELIADELFAILANDVHTEKIAVTLTVQPGKSTKKLRKQLAKEVGSSNASKVATTGRDKLANKLANEGPCLAALNVFYWMIHSAGVVLKPTVHKAIQELVLTVLLDVQRSCKLDMPIPYSSADCRLAAYKLLLALTMEPHASWPPPTQFALHVLAQGQTDVNAQVSGYCTVALSSVEKLIHPVSQTLIFPVSLEEMRKAVRLDEPRNDQNSVDLTDDRQGNLSIPSNVSTTNSTSVRNMEESDEELNNELDRSSKLSDSSSIYSLDIDKNGKTNDLVTSPEVLQSAPPPPTPSSPTGIAVKRKTPEVDTKQQSAKRSVSFGLLGGSEVVKKPRIGEKVIDISSNDPDVVDLSSGEDDDISLILTESNISVASSNSNYQDSVLNKSAVSETLEPQDKNDDIEVVGPEPCSITQSVAKTPPKKRIIQTRVYLMENRRMSPRKPLLKASEEMIQEVVLTDDGDVEIVQSENKDGMEIVESKNKDGMEIVESKNKDGDTTEKLEEVQKVNGKEKGVESFDGLTDDQVVDMVMEDFVTLL